MTLSNHHRSAYFSPKCSLSHKRPIQTLKAGGSKLKQTITGMAAGPAAAAMGAMPPVTLKGVILLAVTILLELAGATCMKMSNNFTHLIPSVLLFVFYALSFGLFTV
eukprot:CAMPEP_0202838746 /NCGR_PEP_ID=MMETSP1389-20130828/50273_1 /ASSEMBLY_ACC=CAM_ASM_000865 /TAXON_ID=302021 /ORGANISM="Rhodomonas sp., Strain CCMP768" /LENGTH=106 /DNA_ID=CAMNT_0049515095 /DNA_START=109 /DNA_END=425 /DNA_ORIENTATION=+